MFVLQENSTSSGFPCTILTILYTPEVRTTLEPLHLCLLQSTQHNAEIFRSDFIIHIFSKRLKLLHQPSRGELSAITALCTIFNFAGHLSSSFLLPFALTIKHRGNYIKHKQTSWNVPQSNIKDLLLIQLNVLLQHLLKSSSHFIFNKHHLGNLFPWSM